MFNAIWHLQSLSLFVKETLLGYSILRSLLLYRCVSLWYYRGCCSAKGDCTFKCFPNDDVCDS